MILYSMKLTNTHYVVCEDHKHAERAEWELLYNVNDQHWTAFDMKDDVRKFTGTFLDCLEKIRKYTELTEKKDVHIVHRRDIVHRNFILR